MGCEGSRKDTWGEILVGVVVESFMSVFSPWANWLSIQNTDPIRHVEGGALMPGVAR